MADEKFTELASSLVNPAYVQQAQETSTSRQRELHTLLSNRRLPDEGLDEATIEFFIQQLALMDSNNFTNNIGVGEREGRVYCSLVRKRHYYLAHGIGRSGDIMEDQPKAAGSSIISKLTNYLALHALKISGAYSTKAALVLPMATGMSLSLVLQTMRGMNPRGKYVLVPRIDQKSCLKCIGVAGLTPIIIENVLVNGCELRTNLAEIEAHLKGERSIDANDILCVLSTTSCFAPRGPDDVVEISRMCKKYSAMHICNNAYGVQCSRCIQWVSDGIRLQGLTAYVQSTDKNFMVPVGGSIVASGSKDFIASVGKNYAGRASISPILDLFMTLLSMGESTYRSLLTERKKQYTAMKAKLKSLEEQYNITVLETPTNSISIAIAIPEYVNDYFSALGTSLGAAMHRRLISGARMLKKDGSTKHVAGIEFMNFGMHCSDYPHASYVTVACAVGQRMEDVDAFIAKFTALLESCRTHRNAKESVEDVA